MAAVLRVAGSRDPEAVGRYVAGCDVDAHDGMGQATLVLDRRHALRFPDAAEALAYWKRQSTVRPYRGDGKPNRPLTAYTCEVERIPDGGHDAD